jgi:hypothetical protein
VDEKLLAAFATAGASLVVAVLAAVAARLNTKKLHLLQKEVDEHKTRLENELAEQREIGAARREYEYKAKVRLYEQCEPLLFQAIELAQNACYRIVSLANAARRGDIRADGSGWLDRHGYYFQSTAYSLLAPLTTASILRRRLTTVDLSLEPRLQLQYDLLKEIAVSFAHDFEFAEREPKLSYNPDRTDPGEPERELKLREEPMKYHRQGLYAGILDMIVETMVDQSNTRCKSFGEFANDWKDSNSKLNACIPDITDLFGGFHPQARPVLWRVLVAQYLQHDLFLQLHYQGIWERAQVSKLVIMPSRDVIARFDWSSGESNVREATVRQPIEVAYSYLGEFVNRSQNPLIER